MRSLFALWFLALLAPAQQWRQTCGRTSSGLIATHQAALDATQDSLVLIVASLVFIVASLVFIIASLV